MKKIAHSQDSQFIIYTSSDGIVKIDVLFGGETVWLTQDQMAELFQTDRSSITKHIKNIYETNELDQTTTSAKIAQHLPDGRKYNILHYNLDVIISVGYRVNSLRGTQFRIWATQRLREYIIKGFTLDEELLKNGTRFGKDYFQELLEKIREIRASERRFYQKITDIYAQASIDYDPNAQITKEFYATVHNKLHWAITGETAAQLISKRANAAKPNMGLTTWKNSPKGKILKTDVTVAKNYLGEEELKHLNRIVGMYLDYAENQAERRMPMKMVDWVKKLDAFLEFNDYAILKNPGKVTHAVAKHLAEEQYEKFRVIQDRNFESDFDKVTKKILEKNRKGEEK